MASIVLGRRGLWLMCFVAGILVAPHSAVAQDEVYIYTDQWPEDPLSDGRVPMNATAHATCSTCWELYVTIVQRNPANQHVATGDAYGFYDVTASSVHFMTPDVSGDGSYTAEGAVFWENGQHACEWGPVIQSTNVTAVYQNTSPGSGVYVPTASTWNNHKKCAYAQAYCTSSEYIHDKGFYFESPGRGAGCFTTWFRNASFPAGPNNGYSIEAKALHASLNDVFAPGERCRASVLHRLHVSEQERLSTNGRSDRL